MAIHFKITKIKKASMKTTSFLLFERAHIKWLKSGFLPRKQKKAMRKDALLDFYFSEL